MTLGQLAAVLATTPGSLAYHLILIVCLALLYAMSQVQHRATHLPRAARWRLASGWLFSLRLVMMAVLLLSLMLSGSADVLPALNHFIDLAALLVFAWAFLVPQSDRRSDRLLMTAVVFNVVMLAAGLVGPQLEPMGIVLAEAGVLLAWRGLGLTIALGVLALLLVRRPPERYVAGLAVLGLAGGYGAQLLLTGGADPLSSYVRLLNLLAYPILAVAATRAMVLTQAEELGPTKEELDLARLSYTETAESQMVVAMASLASARDSETLARRAARAVAETMRAEYCLLVSAPDPLGSFSIATGYDLIREQPLPGAPLDDKRTPVLASALRQNKVLSLSSRSRSPDLYVLQSILGLESTGPTLLVPIANDREVHGGLLLLSPYARRSWSDEQQAMLQSVAAHLADRFSSLKRSAPVASEAYETMLEAQERIRQLERDNMRLFEAVHGEGPVDLSDVEVTPEKRYDMVEAEETIAILEAEIDRLKSATIRTPELPTSEELDTLKEELQETLQELVEARTRNDVLEEQLSKTDGQAGLRPSELQAIASLAQELRQPMSSVMGYTDLLLGESVGLLGAMQRKFLDRVRAAIERMGALLNDLVQMTALETGTFLIRPAPVDLLSCVEKAVEECGPALREKGLRLEMEFPDEVPAVMGELEAVSQILTHLLKNAIAASQEEASVRLSAQVEGGADDGFLMLSVRDSGEGIPPEDLGRVFQRLYHADRTIIPGLGDGAVGLSLVKALSEALGGRVWVESEVGKGSTFTVLLPLADAAARPAPPEAAQPPPDPPATVD